MTQRPTHEFPSWFNPDGAFMKIVPQDELSIVKLRLESRDKNSQYVFEIRQSTIRRDEWYVGCANNYGNNDTFVSSMLLTTQVLRWMFGLDSYSMSEDEQLQLDFFVGDSLCWGVYIRKEQYLNFLMPNLGNKTITPSRSFVLTADIMEEVRKFLD